MVNRTRSQSGFTLAEAMIVVAILGIISSTSALLMTQLNRYFIMTRARADLQKEARAVMYVMTRELRQAKSASISLSRLSATQPYYSMITFTKEQGTTLTYFQNGNLLCQASNATSFTLTFGGNPVCKTTTPGGRAETLSKNVRYMAFTFPRTDDMTIVSVSMTLQTNSYNGQKKALHMASQQVQVMD